MDRGLKGWAWELGGINADSELKEAETTTMISWQELPWQEVNAGLE